MRIFLPLGGPVGSEGGPQAKRSPWLPQTEHASPRTCLLRSNLPEVGPLGGHEGEVPRSGTRALARSGSRGGGSLHPRREASAEPGRTGTLASDLNPQTEE